MQTTEAHLLEIQIPEDAFFLAILAAGAVYKQRFRRDVCCHDDKP